MKKAKESIRILLAFCMLLTILPGLALAATDLDFTGTVVQLIG